MRVTPDGLYRRVAEASQAAGMIAWGCTDSAPLTVNTEWLQRRRKKRWQASFEPQEDQARVDPKQRYPWAQRILCFAHPYWTTPSRSSDAQHGFVARYARGPDYHDWLRRRLQTVLQALEEEGYRAEMAVDTTPLLERSLAARAGVGFIGKNGLLIVPGYGSFVLLGEVVTNAPVPLSKRLPQGCGRCERCLLACPTQALLGNGQVDSSRCLSYQTQNKALPPQEIQARWGNRIFGCDTCQMVCPYNRDVLKKGTAAVLPNDGKASDFLPWEALYPMSSTVYRMHFRSTAAGWRGKRTLERNALLAMGAAAPLSEQLYQRLQQACNDARPAIREAAHAALQRFEQRKEKHAAVNAQALLPGVQPSFHEK
ncbi:MAG: tRNA epoxyqueuosine(34) reductase QueG [Firmicutes bacterium]|nr:tRNA epoxyqueuosine(34) reductase QueG [Bacillota bacterium]